MKMIKVTETQTKKNKFLKEYRKKINIIFEIVTNNINNHILIYYSIYINKFKTF